ncbi:MAG: hypothetical protein IT374_21600 [Polyangiaceae bacterium]|nr:hypothetical protein [Polyangiaceae bacterium]
MQREIRIALALGCSLVVGCASAPRAEPVTPGAPPPETKVGTTIVAAGDVGTATELFERGKKQLLEERFKEAAATFDLVERGEPRGKLAPQALLHAGLAYEGAGDKATAEARYRALVDGHPKDELVKLAWLRLGRMSVGASAWKDAKASADALLARADLTVMEAIEANGQRALALASEGELDQAARSVEHARDLMEKHHIGEVGRVPHEVAQVFFALGEVRREKSEKIRFEPPPANFGAVFEERAQGLLDAQAAYTDAMRATDPLWAAMAGFRVGQLYRALHADVMVLKLPVTAKTEKDRQLFEGAMRLRYRVLLEKGLKMMDATVRMSERVGEESAWSARARTAKAELEQQIAEQNAFLKKLPVSEADLRKLLEDLQKKRADEAK